MTDQQRDERTVGQVQRIADVCHKRGVDIRPIVPEVEGAVAATKPLREAMEKADMKQYQRQIVADALADSIRGEMR